MMHFKQKIIFIILFLFSISFVNAQPQWSRSEDPGRILAGFENNFSALPKGGQLERKPWSGDYWATYRGGITYRWLQKSKKVDRYKYKLEDAGKLSVAQINTLSPAEKFDLYKGDPNWTLTKLERDRTKVMTKKNIPKWWGLCHSWAPATLLYQSPDAITVKAKNGQTIPFYASDMKALLTYNIDLFGTKKKTHFMGSRCNVSFPAFLKFLTLGLISENQYLNLVRGEACQGMDPGAVHIALSNLIGLKKIGLVMDKTRGAEVWNQAIYAYKTIVDKTKKKRKLTWRGLKVTGKVHRIRTRVTWVNEIGHTTRRVAPEKGLKNITYKYEIYTDNDGDIIGGKWLQNTRPDFFWRIEDPGFHDMMVGIGDLYNKSIANLFRAPKKRRTRPELFNLFRKTARQIRNSQAFIRNTRQLVAARKEERKEYYKEMKDFYLKNYKKLMKKYK